MTTGNSLIVSADARPGETRDSGRFALVLICFVLSGFAGLLYETIWTRQFSFVFGTAELAVATVLAAYFGGLALGAAVAARWTTSVRRPVLVYGFLELGIAASALAIPSALRLATNLYQRVMSVDEGLGRAPGLSAALFYLAASFVILLVPTGFMGATLPLLARYAVHEDRQIGPRVGLLYTANTVGAVLGTLSAAFLFLPRFGLTRTVWIGAATNLVVFFAALAVARKGSGACAMTGAGSEAPGRERPARWILPLVLVSGAVSLGYEVLWTRLLGHILGGTLYAFATMLASFLLGIALGSAVTARWASTPSRAAKGFAWAQIGIGLLSWAAFYGAQKIPALPQRWATGSISGWWISTTLVVLVLLPSTMCMGASFPFAVRIFARSDAEAGTASARVYAWNTIGAILGSIVTGFFLLPRLEYAGMLLAAAVLNLILSMATAQLNRSIGRRVTLAAFIAGLIMVVARPSEPWEVLRRSPLGGAQVQGELVYYAVGRSATVLTVNDGISWGLHTNGLPEASVMSRGGPPSRSIMPAWLAALPVLARPEAKSMLVIGFGGGVLLESAPSSLDRIDVVELEPEVIEANRRIGAERARDPLTDPRVHLYVNDARGALVLARDRFDAIVSQPSHPWTVGASNLYTKEFFSLIKDHLNPNGVFVQWMGTRFIDADLLRSLLAALESAFNHIEVYMPGPSAMLFVASASPLDVRASSERAIKARPRDFAAAGVFTVEDVLAALLIPSAGVRSFAGRAQPITDELNDLQFRSGWRFKDDLIRPALFEDALTRFDLGLAEGKAIHWDYLVRRVARMGLFKRARRLALACPDLAESQTCFAWALIAEGKTDRAQRELEATILQQPTARGAKFALLSIRRKEWIREDPVAVAIAEGVQDPALAVLEGWRWQAKGDWQAVKRLEERLALARPFDPAYPDAMQLRAWSRVQSGEPEQLRTAIRLLDEILPSFGTVEDYLLRADASLAIGNSRAVLLTLVEGAPLLRPIEDEAASIRIKSLLSKIGPLAESQAAQSLLNKITNRSP